MPRRLSEAAPSVVPVQEDVGVATEAEIVGEVERFPGVGGWYVVRLGPVRSAEVSGAARRGFVPVRATVGATAWDSSLMPLGDGTLFLALPAAVRRAEDLEEGDPVRARYRLRPGRTSPTAPRPRGGTGSEPTGASHDRPGSRVHRRRRGHRAAGAPEPPEPPERGPRAT